MICLACRDKNHTECSGIKKDPTWCDCQHKGTTNHDDNEQQANDKISESTGRG